MSLATWKREFYRTPASRVSKKNALAHSIRKWEGLSKENLKRHECKFSYGFIGDEINDFRILGSELCALCHHYLKEFQPYCASCPLALSRDGISCDLQTLKEKQSPYSSAHGDRPNVKPMLRALRKAEKFVQIQAAKGAK